MFLILFTGLISLVYCKKFKDGEDKPAWAKKDIRDYNEADLERLLDQWEVYINIILFKESCRLGNGYCSFVCTFFHILNQLMTNLYHTETFT